MADKKSNRGYAIFMGVMIVLLMLCIALFVYGSMTNGIPRPVLPGTGHFALGTMHPHG